MECIHYLMHVHTKQATPPATSTPEGNISWKTRIDKNTMFATFATPFGSRSLCVFVTIQFRYIVQMTFLILCSSKDCAPAGWRVLIFVCNARKLRTCGNRSTVIFYSTKHFSVTSLTVTLYLVFT